MSMTTGFDITEATDLLRLDYITTALDPQNVVATTDDPFSDHDIPATTTHASPIQPVWPSDWGPLPGKTWKDSVVCSVFREKDENDPWWVKKLTVGNSALVAYHKTTGQYALCFAGTENKFGALEDLAAIPISAGPLDQDSIEKTLDFLKDAIEDSGKAPLSDPAMNVAFKVVARKLAKVLSGPNHYVGSQQVQAEKAQVDMGFRLGFESLFSPHTSGEAVSKTPLLTQVLELIPDGSDLFVSGHSLGGAIATLATAWLQAGNFPKQFNLKTYTFAAPKSGNEIYVNYLNNALGNRSLFYRVYNELDTIPQVPFTFELPGDLNNPAMLGIFLDQLPEKYRAILDKILNAGLPGGWSLNYTHAGLPHPLPGQLPVVYGADSWPEKYFPGHDQPLPPLGNSPQERDKLQNWWQHMPWVYLDLLMQQN